MGLRVLSLENKKQTIVPSALTSRAYRLNCFKLCFEGASKLWFKPSPRVVVAFHRTGELARLKVLQHQPFGSPTSLG
ncbi:unnamed protein product [Dovyalis caffra]|uniref:Uncharacterized protein n=1 Tax=Dovyalis caffra TaxID=77055 RepID=A0AAV1QVA2_9ROSI|nr:unnamed protein product [Dovyalis caffra]